jgi:hypothetical protein
MTLELKELKAALLNGNLLVENASTSKQAISNAERKTGTSAGRIGRR